MPQRRALVTRADRRVRRNKAPRKNDAASHSHPGHFAAENFAPLTDADDKSTVLVDPGRDTGLRTRRGIPRDPHADTGRGPPAPRIENRIGSSTKKVPIPRCHCRQRLGPHGGPSDRSAQLRLERSASIGKSGGYAFEPMLIPYPRITDARSPFSARMPASFRRPTSRSFGHLMSAFRPVVISMASANATPAASVNCPGVRFGSNDAARGLSTIDT